MSNFTSLMLQTTFDIILGYISIDIYKNRNDSRGTNVG